MMRIGDKWNMFLLLALTALTAPSLAIETSTTSTATPTTTASTTTLPITTTKSATTTTTVPSTTTQSVEQACASRNDSCGDCTGDARCLWCYTPYPHCLVYPATSVLPPSSTCPLTDARWGTCTVNYQTLLICMGVLAGILVLTVAICCCCCCCRRRKGGLSVSERRAEAADSAESEARQSRNAERRAERQVRYDEIRRKYGLGGGSASDGAGGSTGYSRFENDPQA